MSLLNKYLFKLHSCIESFEADWWKNRDITVSSSQMTPVLWKTDLKTWVVFKHVKQYPVETFFFPLDVGQHCNHLWEGKEIAARQFRKAFRVLNEIVPILREFYSLTIEEPFCSLGNDLTHMRHSGNISQIMKWAEKFNLQWNPGFLKPSIFPTSQ